jgi:hypothetical protein
LKPTIIPGVGGAPDKAVGLTLAAVPSGALLDQPSVRHELGIIDLLSDNPSRGLAMLRSGGSGIDLSTSYPRRVWKCADGFLRNPATNVCEDKINRQEHTCSDALGVIAPSSGYLDVAQAPMFARMTNRRLACCMGQKRDPLNPTKFHCVQSDASSYPTFDEFYDAGAGGSLDFAGVKYPNRLFLLDNNKRPVPGVYTKEGTRCPVLDNLTPTRQMQALTTIRANIQLDTKANPFRGIPGVNAGAIHQIECRYIVRTALEAVCPPEGIDPITGGKRTVTAVATDPTYKSAGGLVRQCFQPEALRIHYAIEDMTDTNTTRRGIVRTVSSIGANSEPAGSVDIQRLIRQTP